MGADGWHLILLVQSSPMPCQHQQCINPARQAANHNAQRSQTRAQAVRGFAPRWYQSACGRCGKVAGLVGHAQALRSLLLHPARAQSSMQQLKLRSAQCASGRRTSVVTRVSPPDVPGPKGPKKAIEEGREWLGTILSRFGPVRDRASSVTTLDFEKPLLELDKRIKEVRPSHARRTAHDHSQRSMSQLARRRARAPCRRKALTPTARRMRWVSWECSQSTAARHRPCAAACRCAQQQVA